MWVTLVCCGIGCIVLGIAPFAHSWSVLDGTIAFIVSITGLVVVWRSWRLEVSRPGANSLKALSVKQGWTGPAQRAIDDAAILGKLSLGIPICAVLFLLTMSTFFVAPFLLGDI
jgi:hypothetical protein